MKRTQPARLALTRHIAGRDVRVFAVRLDSGAVAYRTYRQLTREPGKPCRCNDAGCQLCRNQYQNASLIRQGV